MWPKQSFLRSKLFCYHIKGLIVRNLIITYNKMIEGNIWVYSLQENLHYTIMVRLKIMS